MSRVRALVMTGALLAIATACSAPESPTAATVAPAAASAQIDNATAPTPAPVPPASRDWPAMVVHKSPTCGCCGLWVDHMREAGFMVEVRDADNLEPVKSRLGIPYGKGSCHTAEVGGYFIEGHVPAADVKRLLTERPAVKGLVLPGMPMGSPGMEAPDGRRDAYTVEAVAADGTTQSFAQHAGSPAR
jgi:hypothetical protein